MTVRPTEIAIEAEVTSGVFTDLTPDVENTRDIRANYGTHGSRPTDRVSRPGKLDFYLRNDLRSVGAALGYYTPDHTNVLSGWEIGKPCRFWIAYLDTSLNATLNNGDFSSSFLGDGRDRYYSSSATTYIELAAVSAFNHAASIIEDCVQLKGTMGIWFELDSDEWASANNNYMFHVGTTDSDQQLGFFKTTNASEVRVRWTGAEAAGAASVARNINHTVLAASQPGPHFAVATWDFDGASSVIMYFDGASRGSAATPRQWGAGSPVDFAYVGNTVNSMRGKLGHWFVYDTPLSSDDIADIYSCSSDQFQKIHSTCPNNLRLYYPLWESEGSTIARNYSGSTFFKFYGKLGPMEPKAGEYKEKNVKLRADSWMKHATQHKVKLLDVSTNQPTDEVLNTVIDSMDYQPRARDFNTAQETLVSVLDDLKDGRTTAFTVFQRAMMSEFGYLTEIGDKTGGGTLQFEDRHARVKNKTVDLYLSASMMRDVRVKRDPDMIYNRVEAKTYPRNVGASDEILGILDNPLEISGNSQEEITLFYRDPDSQDVRLSGASLLAPEGDNWLDTRGFESGSTNWEVNGDTASLTRTTTCAIEDSYSMLLESGTSADGRARMQLTEHLEGASHNQEYYYQVVVNIPDTWPQFIFRISERDSASSLTDFDDVYDFPTPTSGSQLLFGKHTISASDTEGVKLFLGCQSLCDFSGGNKQAYIDSMVWIEASALNFQFSSASIATGDKDGDLSLVHSILGGNSAKYICRNTSDVSGYITKLNTKGRAIRLYNPVDRTALDQDSIDDHGDKPVSLHLYYQDDPNVGQDFADSVLSLYKDPQSWVEQISFNANQNAELLEAALRLEPGARISIVEEMTAINAEYVIAGVALSIRKPYIIDCTWSVVPASTADYWLMGVAGSSEAGETTIVGF